MLSFQNPGEIDIDAAMMLGVNAKTSSNAIGYFGTGLKFAIATLLRTGHEVIIWQGKTPYDFSTSRMETRGKEFFAVLMNGRNLGFTTELGKNWQIWQAFRELYSNTMDEGGFVKEAPLEPKADTTIIEVRGIPITQVWEERHRYLLQSTPLETYKEIVAVHPGSGIYMRGILVDEGKTSFAYNINTSLGLTEDRMLADQWSAHYGLCKAILNLPKTLKFLLANPKAAEHQWPWPSSPVMEPECVRLIHEQNYDALPHSIKAIHQATSPDTDTGRWKALLPSQEKAVNQAKEILRRLGQEVTAPVLLLWPPSPTILGRAKDGKIGLSARIFAESLPRLASTLLEEHLHDSMGLADNTRAMQDVLLELAIKGALQTPEAPSETEVPF